MNPAIRPSRRQLLRAGALSVPATLAAAALVPAEAAPLTQAPRVRGADISFTRQLERAGVTWSVDGAEGRVEELLHQAGANWVRLRVWTDPPRGYSTVDSSIRLARRAKRLGMRVLLDLHYSDFWADPAHQTTPRAWQGQDLPTLADTVRTYTSSVLERFSAAGCPVDMVQIGNEITAGMLWPHGQVYAGAEADWHGFTELLRAAELGARTARVSGRRPRVMIHIDRGGDNGGSRWFFDHVFDRGVDCDLIGLSYYPFWHGPIDALENNLNDLAGRYDRDLIVVETAYPWTLRNGDDLENHIDTAEELPDAHKWPATRLGQLRYFRALRNVFARVPGGRGLGFMVWEPEWIPGVGWTPGEGNPNDNLTMFDWHGRGLPSLEVFRA